MFNFEKLDVWKKAIDFADLVYLLLTRRLKGRHFRLNLTLARNLNLNPCRD